MQRKLHAKDSFTHVKKFHSIELNCSRLYTAGRLFILLPWDVHSLDSLSQFTCTQRIYTHKINCTELKRMKCDMRIVMNAMTKQDYFIAKQEEKVLSMEHTWNN